MTYSKHISKRNTPQSQPIRGKRQVRNHAGGFTFALDKWEQLRRFLILGCEGGTYYTNERKLAVENADVIQACIDEDPSRVFQVLKQINDQNQAIKHDTVLFAYGILCASHAEYFDHILEFCRIGTHLFSFAQTIKELRGWGRTVRRAFAKWYNQHPALDYQLIKYQNRNGWTHRDVLRQAHVHPDNEKVNDSLKWAVRGEVPAEGLISVAEQAKRADQANLTSLIRQHRLPRECVPTQHLNSIKVWEALLESMPMTAMIRNLGKMTSVGLLSPMNERCKEVAAKLSDSDRIRKSRVHPFSVLLALKTYASGGGFRGSLKWTPDRSIVEALNQCFELSFQNLSPSGKRFYLGIDVSGSMGAAINRTNITCREAAAALAMMSVKSEANTYSAGFTGGFGSGKSKLQRLTMTRNDSLESILKRTANLDFGSTDCALPMLDARERGILADVFVVLTDNETWFGNIHPCQALEQYRQATGIDAKLVVVGMTATKFTIADPSDPGMLDIVGFDSSGPAAISEFAKM